MRRLVSAVAVVPVVVCFVSAASPIVQRRAIALPSDAAASVEAIAYISDGLRVNGYLAMPRRQGVFPSVIYNRGGNSTLNVWTDEAAIAALGKVASWGYVVVASQYRGAGGSEGRDEYGGADVDDVLNLIPVLESLPNVDKSRIGMYGASRGGMMTYLALARTDRIRAAVVLSGMSDLFENRNARPEMAGVFERYMPDYPANAAEALRRRSAIRWVDALPSTVPLLLIHGTADWRVSPSEAFDLARALAATEHPVRFLLYEGGSHGVPEFAAERDAAVRGWLDAYLRDGRKWPDLKPHGS